MYVCVHLNYFIKFILGLLHYNKTSQKSFIRNDYLKRKMKYSPISKVLAR